MDYFTIFVVIVLVVMIFASFKYPTEFYLGAHGERTDKRGRIVFYLIAIIVIFGGTYAIAELIIFAMIFFIDVTTIVRIISYTIAFVVEAIGNLLYIMIRYGGISELSNVQIIYEDEDEYEDEYDNEYEDEYDNDDDKTKERKNNIISLEEYRRRKGKWS